MRYGVIGDIHANLEALDAVLELLEQQRVDEILCIGDIVGYGAQPAECLQRLRDLRIACVAGNHDLAAAGTLDITYFNEVAKSAILWTRAQIDPDGLEYLRDLPMVRPFDTFVLVHSSLEAPERFDYVMDWEDAKASFAHLASGMTCFFGHSHVPITFLSADNLLVNVDPIVDLAAYDKALVNVGSVGQPRDQNPDASCVVYDSEARQIIRHRVPYDVESAANKILDAGLPQFLAERIRVGQ